MLLAIAGAMGTLGRHAVNVSASRYLGAHFPFGTLAVNCFGCLLAGFLAQFAIGAGTLSPGAKLAIMVGFLGAFTTFSSMSYETVALFEAGSWRSAGTNIAANLVLGLGATMAGLAAARGIFGRG